MKCEGKRSHDPAPIGTVGAAGRLFLLESVSKESELVQAAGHVTLQRVFFWLTGTTCFEGSVVSLSVGPDRGITRGGDGGRDPRKRTNGSARQLSVGLLSPKYQDKAVHSCLPSRRRGGS